MGTEVVLKSIYSLRSELKKQKICIPMYTQFYYIKVGLIGVLITWACLLDEPLYGLNIVRNWNKFQRMTYYIWHAIRCNSVYI